MGLVGDEMEQMYEFGIYKGVTVVSTLINLEDLWAVGPDKMQGIHLMEWVHTIGAPGAQAFVAGCKKRFPSTFIPVPTANTLNGYIGTREMLRAIRRAGKDDVASVIKALEGRTSPDSLKHDPLTIRDWDHKFLWASFAFSMQKYVGFWLALLIAPLLVGVVGLILERLVIHRTYGSNPLFGLLLTFGLVTALEEVIRMVWGKAGYSVAAPKFAAAPSTSDS